MIASNIRVPGSYNDVDASGANSALPAYRQPILIVAPRIKAPSAWVTLTVYALGAVVKPTANGNNYYICVVAGTSGGPEPTWPAVGGTVTDGTVTWRHYVVAQDIIAVHTPTRVYSPDQAAQYAGSGSIAHRMVRAAIRQYRYAEVTLCSVEDDNSGVKATGTLVVAGTASAPGTIEILLGLDKISYSFATGDLAAAIATAIDGLIASYKDLPVVSDVTTATITLRAKNAGTPGNLLGRWSVANSKYEPVVTVTSGAGITVTVTGFASGATDPDLVAAYTACLAEHYSLVAQPYFASTEMADLKSFLAESGDEVNCRGARAFIANTKTIAEASTLADINYERIHVALARGVRMPAWEIAAAVAADHAATGHPALPLNNRPLYDCDMPPIASRLEFTEIQTLLYAGVTPYNADSSGVMRCVRSITSYTNNAAGSPDELYLDTTTIANLDYTRQSIRTRHLRDYSSSVLRDNHVDGEPSFIVTPDDIKSTNLDVCLRLEKFGCLQNVKALKDQFVSVRDSNVAGRVNSDIPTEVVQGLYVLANTLRIVTSV